VRLETGGLWDSLFGIKGKDTSGIKPSQTTLEDIDSHQYTQTHVITW